MNARNLILDKIANDEVLFVGDSESSIRQILKDVFDLAPEQAQVFGHAYDGSKVFFRCVNEKTRPVNFSDEQDVNEFIYNKTTILNAWNINLLIKMFDGWSFDRLVSFAMHDGRAYICLNNMDGERCERALCAVCDLADSFGCYDDDEEYKSTYDYASALIPDRYSYLFRHDDGILDGSTGLGTTAANHPNVDIVFPIWLLSEKYAEEDESRMMKFEDLF